MKVTVLSTMLAPPGMADLVALYVTVCWNIFVRRTEKGTKRIAIPVSIITRANTVFILRVSLSWNLTRGNQISWNWKHEKITGLLSANHPDGYCVTPVTVPVRQRE